MAFPEKDGEYILNCDFSGVLSHIQNGEERVIFLR